MALKLPSLMNTDKKKPVTPNSVPAKAATSAKSSGSILGKLFGGKKNAAVASTNSPVRDLSAADGPTTGDRKSVV